MSAPTRDGGAIADGHWHDTTHHRKGFFTDTSICIGCKACEVACKEWNRNPQDGTFELLGSSYDNTGSLGANTWRHVAFIEQDSERIEKARESGRKLVNLGMPSIRPRTDESAGAQPLDGALGAAASGSSGTAGDANGLPSTPPLGIDLLAPGALEPSDPENIAALDTTPPDTADFRWLMSSDVCKHCTHAGCLDVCPTGALFRTEFDTVVVQNDVCNGCGTCVAGCPFGVIERRDDGTINTPTDRDDRKAADMDVPNKNTANKCTLCYDRLVEGQEPACAQTCPTQSIKFGDRDDMVSQAHARVADLHAKGLTEARLYGANPNDGVGGTGSVFLLLDEPEVYGLPPDPRVATKDLPGMFASAGVAALGMVAAAGLAFLGSRR
ncbi:MULTISPECIES: 4Fe-4S dicluster domain-containing protein [unclassified Brevibacterium]|uniref:4Fe-4S dicluster domain-containing protein n=1 Tax=unclassified Brevibacterium TaxID=2614124 RepID=UPI001E3C0BE9|nr:MULTISPECIES: 4Fe-4S dicluster domain-containing protein [unclassified Brevibacterium]MCD1286441.1 4Fe-4S ferredoxin [Brevibacterium sp. CCUG 69071]MDK8433809.1 4Fe-4S dicluster domain-containing protein [Brevibacterium sp. H-BE7]